MINYITFILKEHKLIVLVICYLFILFYFPQMKQQ